MSIAAKVSAAELSALATANYADKYYEARLINAPGVTYQPGVTSDATFLGYEVAYNTGGYKRQVIKYATGDVGSYADNGVAMATKATVFAHDGGATPLQFTHAVLVQGSGNALTLGAKTAKPTAAVNGTYTNIPVVATGSGKNLTVNLVITNGGAALGDYALTIVKPGYSFTAAEGVSIPQATLQSIGAITSGTGNLSFSVATVTSSSGRVLGVAQTANTVALTAGNEAAFYWNLKLYGYAS
jgi:hypothetical protein